jgi:surfeit locus 1 family protein
MNGAAGQGAAAGLNDAENCAAPNDAAPRPRTVTTLVVLAICAALAFGVFAALGTWQVHRLQWKLALIDRVNQRVHALPVPTPGPARWPQISAKSDEYRHVRVTGTFLFPLTTRVQAVTDLGSGYWLLTPLRDSDGNIVMVNRGFVPAQSFGKAGPDFSGAAEGSPRTITGLLRISEPGGGFLRHNDAAGKRWYSRDVAAIGAASGLQNLAPYFIDADAGQPTAQSGVGDGAATRPVGGLTAIAFHNSHMVYAVTWYALALMVLGGAVRIGLEERRLRSRRESRANSGKGSSRYGGAD